MTRFEQFVPVAETGFVDEIFAQLERDAQADIGAIIFSCSTFDPKTRQARRVYTNQPQAYPLSGLKEIIPGRWTEIVLDGGKNFVANTIEQIADVFPDHQLIASLGCGSALNIPVKLAGNILGTVNLLHETGYFTGSRVERALSLKPAAMIAFAALSIGSAEPVASKAK